jgi:hypothetical protein
MASESSSSPTPGGSFAGVLDVHIIEAVDLATNKKLKADKLSPYVVGRLASKDSSKQSTLPAKGPTYRWGLMLNFFVFSTDDVLVLDVKEKQMLKDIPRGTVKIPLNTLLPGQLADMWVPLSESEKKGALLGGRLHIEITLKAADADAIAATPKSKRKTAMLQSTGSLSNLASVGHIKIEDIGDISIVAPEGEWPITADPRGPTPYSLNPGTGEYEIPQMAFSGFFVLDRDVKEI